MLKWTEEFKTLLDKRDQLTEELREVTKQVVSECPHIYERTNINAMQNTYDDSVCEICGYSARAGY